jgi:hypothetical protein
MLSSSGSVQHLINRWLPVLHRIHATVFTLLTAATCSIFDTAIVNDGCMYMLDQDVERFVKSAKAARITPPYHPGRLRDIFLDTAAASGCPNGAWYEYGMSKNQGSSLEHGPNLRCWAAFRVSNASCLDCCRIRAVLALCGPW